MPQASAKQRRAGQVAEAWVDSSMTYLSDSSVPPVWHRPLEEGDGDWHEGNYRSFPVRIHDMRPIADDLSLDRNGFMLVGHRTQARALSDLDEVLGVHAPEMEALLMEITGASRLVMMYPAFRDVTNKQPFLRPFHLVHSDFTDETASEWAFSLLTEGGFGNTRSHRPLSSDEAQVIMQRRYAEYNIWRPINGPVLREPLGVVDASTIGPDDFTTLTSEAGNIPVGMHNPSHRWYYAPEMETDEILIIKCYDSARDGRARFTFHSAFEHPGTKPDAPIRRNIELRFFAFFDE